ncbi:serum amyloid P-component [Echinops telfairi]|uniref:Pentraxin family member n=1 Tax=Echinops telfairi TaxID=9371 RepID=A0ABM0J7G6_ECHTE|nr:serum amyloid P-component [Echinops telfairi]
MDKLLLWVSVLITLTGAFAQTDLSGKVLVFPRESSRDHVSLITQLDQPLQNFTLCLRAYSDLSRPYSLFSYSTKEKDNELLIFKVRTGVYNLYIGQSEVTFNVLEDFPVPVHICASWESASGIAQFWVNGKPAVKKGLKRGYSVGASPKIILGQEQDSYGGGFKKEQSFVGEIGDLYMWDSVLSKDEIQSTYDGFPTSPSILNWENLNYEINGYVIIEPLVWK